MNRTDAPKKQPVAFGVNGQRENLPDTTPSGDNTASYDAGFPAVTMILKSAGGLPPKGQDMNQILFELSAIGRWLSAGAINSFDASFSTSIGGYPQASVLVGNDGTTIYISTVDANTNDPNTTSTGWLSLSKITSMAGLAGGVDKIPYFDSETTANQTDFTSVGRDIVGQTSVANVLSYLGIGGVREAVFITSGTWTCPVGVTSILLDGCGGGGGGSCGAASAANGNGGGGANAVVGRTITVVPGTAYTVTIGTGGVGGTSSSTTGTTGGTSSFGTLLSLTGGGGASRTSPGTSGGDGGAAGRSGSYYSGLGSFGGAGGGCYYSAPSPGAILDGSGITPTQFGGGGGGGVNNAAGGAGAGGYIRLSW